MTVRGINALHAAPSLQGNVALALSGFCMPHGQIGRFTAVNPCSQPFVPETAQAQRPERQAVLQRVHNLHMTGDSLAHQLQTCRAQLGQMPALMDAQKHGVGITLHADENLNCMDFSVPVADAYLSVLIDTIQIARECGVDEIPVYVVGGHDTASAVAAVPAEGGDYAYLSSGTWSLLGVLSKEPKTDEKVMNAEYTNEGAVDGSIRLLKNIMGLWIIQECKREWDRRSDKVDFAELVKMAERAPKFKALIDVDDPCFLAPGDMPARIQDYCRRTGQAVPEGRGEISRVVYEGLALKYRWSIEKLENEILNRKISQLNIVGGGSKNALLNQFTADAIGRDVIAGPSEGTVIGNLLLQAQAVGAMREEDRAKVVARSFPTETFKPENAAEWDAAYEKYLKMF